MKKQPRPHQRRALRDIVPSITQQKRDRVTSLMPCGTGKTMTQLWTIEALMPKTVLVLLPSLALIRQTLREWTAETKWKKLEVLCVCSDKTVSRRSEDEVDISPEEVGYPVTSDSGEIGTFFSRKSVGVKLMFSTYHSAPLVADGMEKGFAFDVAVFDEAHVTAGEDGRLFSFALENKNLPIKVRTFWTATPRHYSLDKTGRAGTKPAYSMDDESVYGPVVHKLTFKAATAAEIICDYEVVVSVVTNKMLGVQEIETGEVIIDGERVPAKIVAHHMALEQAIKKYGLKKIFTFHARVADAREFTNGGPQSAARHLPSRFQTFHVNGAMSTAERDALLKQFRQAEHALMSNARCLTQGIDVPDVDGVAFLCKKRGLIDIVQAAGRAMRKAPGKKKGYILVPLYVNLAAGETVDEASVRSEYREVLGVLNALRDEDDVLAAEIAKKRGWNPKSGGPLALEKLTVVGPCINIEKLRAAITTICVDRLARTREMYETWQEAGEAARRLGLSTTEVYRAGYKQDPHLPSNPSRTYPDFPSWPKFLRDSDEYYTTWQEAGEAARAVGLSTQKKYHTGYKQDPRLPSNPNTFYPNFPGWPKFLRDTDPKKYYATWQEAGKAVRRLGLSTGDEYRVDYKRDLRLPSDPEKFYPNFPGWPKFLRDIDSVQRYETWRKAGKAARQLGLSTCTEYQVDYKKDPRLPAKPQEFYADFPGWPKFLRDADPKKYYATWQEAGEAARKLGLFMQAEYRAGYKQDPRLPSNPYKFYPNFPGWPKFLGKR